ncbi:MAG: helix-turn-helix transcriptional regulator [Myxococcota bacterium]
MDKRDTAPSPRGAVLHPQANIDIRRVLPGAALSPFVAYFWLIRWDLPAPTVQRVLPRPAVNLVSERDRWMVSGVQTQRYDRILEGCGAVFGVLFRPTGYAAFTDRPLYTLTDRTEDMAARMGICAETLHTELCALSDAQCCARLEALLLRLGARACPHRAALDALVEHARTDPSLIRAEQLASQAGVGLRTLQRRMRRDIGIGPKALLRRFRLQEAVARIEEGTPLADLAYALGYCDQAHFCRDFTAVIGAPPSRYRP